MKTRAAAAGKELGNLRVAMILLSALLCLVPRLSSAQSGVVNSTQNPLQLALLH